MSGYVASHNSSFPDDHGARHTKFGFFNYLVIKTIALLNDYVRVKSSFIMNQMFCGHTYMHT